MGLQMSDLPIYSTMVDNIVNTYRGADGKDLLGGTEWYENTRKLCKDIADKNGYPEENVVGAYAVLSPALNKEQNDIVIVKAVAAHKQGLPVEEWPKIGTYGMGNRRKADRCLSGDLTAVSGKKVSAFYRNILGIPQYPTVDRWAVRVALDNPFLGGDKIAVGSKKVYNAVADAYIGASSELGVVPSVCQAVTWEVFRNRYYRQGENAMDKRKAA